MRPHTKEQVKVLAMSRQLKPLGEKAKEWSIKSQLTHLVYVMKHDMICFTCGHKWPNENINQIKCPHCGNKLEIPSYWTYDYTGGKQKRVNIIDKTWSHTQEGYTTVFEIHNGYQVMRHLRVYCWMRKGNARSVKIDEVVQDWISPQGKHTIVAHQMNSGMFGSGPSWVFFDRENKCPAEMDIKVNYGKYHINGDLVPRGKMLPLFKKHLHTKIDGITYINKIIAIMDYRMEAILKSGYTSVFRRLITDGGVNQNMLKKYWPAIKICQRNKYDLDSQSYMWFEHVDDLIKDGKDIRNAHYVCPKDLRAAHQVYVNRAQKALERKRELDLLGSVEKMDAVYQTHIEKFRDIIMSTEQFTIAPIMDVFDFYKEGQILHHCVFTRQYYEKKDSLILSARTADKRLETIQVNLKTMKVTQAHGLCNENSEYHELIVETVKNHLPIIRNAKKNRLLRQPA